MTPEQKTKPLSRRQFLGLTWAGASLLLMGQSLVALLNFLKPVSKGGFGGEVYAGKLEEFAVNSVNRILTGRFFVVRTEQGLLALWQKCPHLGCAVPWVEEDGQFHCPCHGSLYDRYGDIIGGPAPRPLDTFPLAIRDGEVWVDTGKPTVRSRFDPSQLTQV